MEEPTEQKWHKHIINQIIIFEVLNQTDKLQAQSHDMQQDRISYGAKVEHMKAVTALISEPGNICCKFCLQRHVCRMLCPPSSKKNTHTCLANDPKLTLGKTYERRGIDQNVHQRESAC